MTIVLARDVEGFLQNQVRSGVCADPSELVNDVIRSIRPFARCRFQMSLWYRNAAGAIKAIRVSAAASLLGRGQFRLA